MYGWKAVVATAALIAGVFVAFAVGVHYLDKAFNKADAADAKYLKALQVRVNHACKGGPPVRATFHNSGWSHGPYWEVQCANGRVLIIQ